MHRQRIEAVVDGNVTRQSIVDPFLGFDRGESEARIDHGIDRCRDGFTFHTHEVDKCVIEIEYDGFDH